MKFNMNENVVYGTQGVCVVEGTTERILQGNHETYYVLKTVFGNSTTIFVPVGNEKLIKKMRRVLSAEEINSMIDAIPDASTIWIDDDAMRLEEYKNIILSGDRQKIIQLIKTLYGHSEHQRSVGRKLHQADERVFREAEKILYDEFALVLGLEPENVLDYISERIGATDLVGEQ